MCAVSMDSFPNTTVALSNLLEKFKCNNCDKLLKSTCSFELCDHFFCKSCANHLVNESKPCPKCDIVLWKEHMQDIHWVPEVLSTIEKIDKVLKHGVDQSDSHERQDNSFNKVKEDDYNDNDSDYVKDCIPDHVEPVQPLKSKKASIISGKRKSNGEKSTTIKTVNKNTKKEQSSTRSKPRGVRTERKNGRGETPLHIACIKGDVKRVKELLELGAKVNTRDFAQWTPLHEACVHGFREIVELLITNGAYIDATAGDDCVTPMHDAVSNNHLEVVKFLLKRKDSPTDVKNALGQLPKDLCKTNEMLELFGP